MLELRRAVARVRSEQDAGMTLIELLVSMVVFSVAVGLAFTAVIQTMQWGNEVERSSSASHELRTALAQIDRQVRSGNVLFSPADETIPGDCVPMDASSGTCMRIFTQSNGDEKCVQWQIAADAAEPGRHLLRTRSWAMDWQSTGNVSTWSTVARDLHLDTAVIADAPFRLLGADPTDPAFSVYKERALQVTLQAFDERRDVPVEITSTLTGRNTSYGYDAGQCLPVPPA